MAARQSGNTSGTSRASGGRSSGRCRAPRTNKPAKDRQELEWRFDVSEMGLAEDAATLHYGLPGSKPFRLHSKGEEWKDFERATKDARKTQDQARDAGKAVR